MSPSIAMENPDMPLLYQNLGWSRRLYETVFAGAHDASITSGSSCAQTQSLDIADQARAGVRLFDLRIIAQATPGGPRHVGYHGSPGGKKVGTLAVPRNAQQQVVTHAKITGEFGLGLSEMLDQARHFVTFSGEFLIFKFDKCTNYALIADECVQRLGDAIYKPIGKEFGKLTLGDLSGKVVCVFNDSALPNMAALGAQDGILGFRSLRGEKNSVGAYDPLYAGLQYYGKGGTSPLNIWKTKAGKIDENEEKQRKMLLAMAAQANDDSPNVLGMMYWTSTGSISSIASRNRVMWGATGVRRMEQLWEEGLEASIRLQAERDRIRVMRHGGIPRLKAYFPNIVMIDFADPDKCQTIYDLNTAADARLIRAYSDWRSAA
ncbi:hypothetical protein LDO26_06555 [Luteimonas sp. BDR2-5]|uniref:hypothetical protein n=1 Tax=Proluteimonas luteida TaxID=2878685 RepID=UPI001E5D207F|nr:hypothetical protein [Luteimonas sp. BDR2-5]MCD9027864.1 hypothetical protein [Luteimonas sp. BDR2-5]